MGMKAGSIILLNTRNMLCLKGKHYFRVKGWEKIFQLSGPKNQTGVATLISNKIDVKVKSISRDCEEPLVRIIGTIH